MKKIRKFLFKLIYRNKGVFLKDVDRVLNSLNDNKNTDEIIFRNNLEKDCIIAFLRKEGLMCSLNIRNISPLGRAKLKEGGFFLEYQKQLHQYFAVILTLLLSIVFFIINLNLT